ncbi:hypothetical protein HAX54_014510 [Datura stramonium]|uniref:Uncharacterized protein n=1 Tax=Datura stramonium TaxID=4076 RepID=A0ABS8TQA8_DATST|nr:hypothetical protein [Datura stramonium]
MTITIYTPAHVSTSGLNFGLLRSPPLRTLSPARYHRNFSLNCMSLPEKRQESRRLVNVALGVLLQWLAVPKGDSLHSINADMRQRRKQLDPLESYIPAVLLAGVQIKELVKLHHINWYGGSTFFGAWNRGYPLRTTDKNLCIKLSPDIEENAINFAGT